ncbi:MAG: hypothetical protein WC840_06170 [Candidatus Peribacteraceae bacterium]
MKLRLTSFTRGAIFGLAYGAITMFPEHVFGPANSSALSIGSLLNLPAIFVLLTFMSPQGFGTAYDRYILVALVLLIDAMILGAIFALISNIFSRRKS